MRGLGMSARGRSAADCRLKRRAAYLVLLTPLLLFVGRGWADQPALVANPEDALSRLDQITQTLQRGAPSDARLVALSDEVSADQSQAQDCISAQTAKTAAITAQIKALGPAVAGESAQATEARAQLAQQQTQAAALLSDCRLLQQSLQLEQIQSRRT